MERRGGEASSNELFLVESIPDDMLPDDVVLETEGGAARIRMRSSVNLQELVILFLFFCSRFNFTDTEECLKQFKFKRDTSSSIQTILSAMLSI